MSSTSATEIELAVFGAEYLSFLNRPIRVRKSSQHVQGRSTRPVQLRNSFFRTFWPPSFLHPGKPRNNLLLNDRNSYAYRLIPVVQTWLIDSTTAIQILTRKNGTSCGRKRLPA